MGVDVRRYVVSASSRTGERDRVREYVFTTGAFSSSAEHSLFQLLQEVESVSAIKLIFEANKLGIPVFGITAANVDLVLPQLTVSSAVVNDVRNAIAAGMAVLIPRDNITVRDWSGAGYIALDPKTGGAAYVISGGLAGGSTGSESELGRIAREMLSVLSFLSDTFEIIAPKLRLGAKAAGIKQTFGRSLSLASAIATVSSVWKKTKSLPKAILAGGITGAIGAVVGAGVGIAAAPLFAGAAITVGTVVGAVTLALSAVVIGTIVEEAAFDFFGIPASFLWPYRRRFYVAEPAPDLIGVG